MNAGILAICLGLGIAQAAIAQVATLPFTISLEEVQVKDSPPLQSFSSAVTTSGQWLCLGGRTTGLHGEQDTGMLPPPSSNFSNFNDKIYVIDPIGKTAISRALSDLVPKELIASLMVTGAQSIQVGDKLVIIGGYGFDSKTQFMMTYSVVTVIDVTPTVKAVVEGKPIGSHIRQSKPDASLRVTGGELAFLSGTYYLIFGQNFPGFYTPSSNGNYTFQVRPFKLNDEDGVVKICKRAAMGSSSTAQFRRRDGNLVPIMQADGGRSLIYYGGVFTPTLGPWHQPIEIGPAEISIDGSGFQQRMCQYDCAILPIFQSSTKSMTTILFGGISELVPNNTGFQKDPKLPFISSISAIVRSGKGLSREFLVCNGSMKIPVPLALPALLGTSAQFLASPKAPFDDGVFLLDQVKEDTTVGYIYGGILASQPNAGKSVASSRIFAIHVKPISSPAIPVKIGP